ncbi:MAG: sugar kinase, ribokinase family, partial [uncultured archaeon A07HR67]
MADDARRTLVVGDTTIDLYPDASVSPGGRLRWDIGGTAANVARWMAMLDGDVAVLTAVGDDFFGRSAARHLERSRVSTEHLSTVDAKSPITLLVPDSERWNAWIDGSCYGFDLPAEPATLLAPYERVHLEGVTLPAAVNRDDVLALAEAADDGGTRLSFDLNGRAAQWATAGAYRRALCDVLTHCDVVFAGDADLALAEAEPTVEGILELVPSTFSATVFVTGGAAETTAASVRDGRVVERVAVAPPAVEVATTAGAGDAFA